MGAGLGRALNVERGFDMVDETSVKKLAAVLSAYGSAAGWDATDDGAAEATLAEIKDNLFTYFPPKPIVWDWIGTTHAFGGGCEVLLTQFTAPEDRKMWRLRLARDADYTWYEEDDLATAQAAAEDYRRSVLAKEFDLAINGGDNG